MALLPPLYEVDEMARRYGIAPWSIDLEQPDHMAWYRRARIFWGMESERNAGIRKRGGVI